MTRVRCWIKGHRFKKVLAYYAGATYMCTECGVTKRVV